MWNVRAFNFASAILFLCLVFNHSRADRESIAVACVKVKSAFKTNLGSIEFYSISNWTVASKTKPGKQDYLQAFLWRNGDPFVVLALSSYRSQNLKANTIDLYSWGRPRTQVWKSKLGVGVKPKTLPQKIRVVFL